MLGLEVGEAFVVERYKFLETRLNVTLLELFNVYEFQCRSVEREFIGCCL